MLKKAVIAASLLLAGGFAFGPPAQAAYIVTLAQVGSNVVATGSGTIDSAALTPTGPTLLLTQIFPIFDAIVIGSETSAEVLYGVTGPMNFGNGYALGVSSGSGDIVGIVDPGNGLAVPWGYVSGRSLSSTATWDNQTFASLGVTPGTYVWTWGSGATADSFTLDIGSAAVPEPGSLLLLATALLGIGALGWSRRRA